MSEQPPPPSVFDQAFLTGVPDVTEVLLIRHAQQQIDPSAVTGDLVDPPLSEHGLRQAEVVGSALSTLRLDAVYSSPLRRALQTAAEIASHHRLEPQVVHDLREVEVFRDVPRDQTPEQFVGREALAEARRRMLDERNWDVYPFSEGSAEFRARVVAAIEAAIAAHPAERIAVVCHGGVINAYLGHVIGSRYDMFFRPAHASVSVVVAGRARRALVTLNDVHHLRSAEEGLHTY
jgi:broad specificity phosphatase PhoE